jgi:hypothetical protein
MKNETIQKSEDFHGLIVKEIENLYFISSTGFVIRKNKILKHNWRRSRSGEIYLTNRMWIKGETQTEYTHRIVAKHFLGCIEGKTVNHKDKNTKNNDVTNLEICTMYENCQHKIKETLKLAKNGMKIILRRRLMVVRFEGVSNA